MTGFSGQYENFVSNYRITIPAKFKSDFPAAAKSTVIVTLGLDDDYLLIFPSNYWDELYRKLSTGTEIQREVLDHYENFADLQKLETNGRIRLKDDVMQIAGIERKIMICGKTRFITVWDYDKFNSQRLKERDRIKSASRTDRFV